MSFEVNDDVSLIFCAGSFGAVPKRPPPDQRVITATRSRMSPAVLRTINACEPTKILQVGGAGHKVGPTS